MSTTKSPVVAAQSTSTSKNAANATSDDQQKEEYPWLKLRYLVHQQQDEDEHTSSSPLSRKQNSHQDYRKNASNIDNNISYLISKTKLLIGRLKKCDIKFKKNPTISGKHCIISLVQGDISEDEERETGGTKNNQNKAEDVEDTTQKRMYIEDTSTNGTFINGNLVGKNNKQLLRFGDRISFGAPTSTEDGSDAGSNIKVPEYILVDPTTNESKVEGETASSSANISGEKTIFITSSGSNKKSKKSRKRQRAADGNKLDDRITNTDPIDDNNPNKNTCSPSDSKKRKATNSNSVIPITPTDGEEDCSNNIEKGGTKNVVSPCAQLNEEVSKINVNNNSDDGNSSRNPTLSSIYGSNRKLQKSNDQLRRALSIEINKVSNLEKEILDLKGKLQKLETMKDSIQQEFDIQTNQIKHLRNNEIQKMKIVIEEMTKQSNRKDEESEALKIQINSITKSSDEKNSEYQSMVDEKKKLRQSLELRNEELQAERNEKDALVINTQALERQNEMYANKIQTLKSEKDEILDGQNKLQVELSTINNLLLEKEDCIKRMSFQAEKQQEQIDMLREDNKLLKESKDQAEWKVVLQEKDYQQLALTNQRIQETMKEAEMQQKELKLVKDKYEKINTELQLEIEKERKDKAEKLLAKDTATKLLRQEHETLTEQSSTKINILSTEITELKGKLSKIETLYDSCLCQNEELKRDVVTIKTQHTNTVQNWNHTKEHLDIQQARLTDALKTIQKAAATFQIGMEQIHTAKNIISYDDEDDDEDDDGDSTRNGKVVREIGEDRNMESEMFEHVQGQNNNDDDDNTVVEDEEENEHHTQEHSSMISPQSGINSPITQEDDPVGEDENVPVSTVDTSHKNGKSGGSSSHREEEIKKGGFVSGEQGALRMVNNGDCGSGAEEHKVMGENSDNNEHNQDRHINDNNKEDMMSSFEGVHSASLLCSQA